MPESVARLASRAGDSDALEGAARAGYAGSGLMHVLIAWIALQVAWIGSSRAADQSGALQALAANGLGRVLLWAAVLGFAGLGLWQLTELVRRQDTGDRIKAAAKSVVYLVLAWTSLTFARGGATSSRSKTRDVTAGLLQHGVGRVLVGAVGLAILGVGGYHVVKGVRKKFLEDLDEHPGPAVVWLAVAGYVAKGVALGIVGILFLLAAVHGSARSATGLDGALHTLRGQPFGVLLLTLVALGFAAYATYSVARARYAKV